MLVSPGPAVMIPSARILNACRRIRAADGCRGRAAVGGRRSLTLADYGRGGRSAIGQSEWLGRGSAGSNGRGILNIGEAREVGGSVMAWPFLSGHRRSGLGQVLLGASLAFLAALAVPACAGGEEVSSRTPDQGSSGGTSASFPRAPGTTTSNPGFARGTVTPLPSPRLRGEMSLEEAIQRRRSVRDYTGEPLLLSEVGQLLWAAQGVTSEWGGRAAPSAGGTYPLELYVVVGEVAGEGGGLAPGVYRYRPGTHDLVAWVEGDRRAALAAASLNQAWVREAAIDVVVAAVFARTTRTYGERGVRYVHLEAGHAAQNLSLQAVGLGLGTVVVGAFYDVDVQEVLELPADHEPLYVIPVGRPAPLT